MSRQREIGKKGEELAREFLLELNYEILETNWRSGKAEIDIIARHNSLLVFVEVKTRSYDYYGQPESFLTSKQRQLLSAAAVAYMNSIGHEWSFRFDVISVLYHNPRSYEIKHLKDAFFPGGI